MPPKKLCSFNSPFSLATASIVLLLAEGSENRTSIRVAFSPYMACRIPSGSISRGMAGSIMSLSQNTCSTPSTCSISAFISSISPKGMPSTVTMPVDARLKSFSRAASPSMESSSGGR